MLKINIKDTKEFLHDTKFLINNKRIILDSLYSQKYQKEYIQYREKLQELQTRFQKTKRDYDRNKKLFEKGVIAAVEYENYKFEYDLNINSIAQLKKQQINNW
ncbi:hypothetical protein [Polaribacter staleyi]|uniref:hypothetical protein n=1 Tax=Polaribacter staleyi TaxID=2022337 RepID=UPI0031BBCA8D